MKFAECVNNVSTFIDLKRLANEYVIDYKRLSYDELKAAMIKRLRNIIIKKMSIIQLKV